MGNMQLWCVAIIYITINTSLSVFTECSYKLYVGTTVFRSKFPQIPRASLPNTNSAAHHGKSYRFHDSLNVR